MDLRLYFEITHSLLGGSLWIWNLPVCNICPQRRFEFLLWSLRKGKKIYESPHQRHKIFGPRKAWKCKDWFLWIRSDQLQNLSLFFSTKTREQVKDQTMVDPPTWFFFRVLQQDFITMWHSWISPVHLFFLFITNFVPSQSQWSQTFSSQNSAQQNIPFVHYHRNFGFMHDFLWLSNLTMKKFGKLNVCQTSWRDWEFTFFSKSQMPMKFMVSLHDRFMFSLFRHHIPNMKHFILCEKNLLSEMKWIKYVKCWDWTHLSQHCILVFGWISTELGRAQIRFFVFFFGVLSVQGNASPVPCHTRKRHLWPEETLLQFPFQTDPCFIHMQWFTRFGKDFWKAFKSEVEKEMVPKTANINRVCKGVTETPNHRSENISSCLDSTHVFTFYVSEQSAFCTHVAPVRISGTAELIVRRACYSWNLRDASFFPFCCGCLMASGVGMVGHFTTLWVFQLLKKANMFWLLFWSGLRHKHSSAPEVNSRDQDPTTHFFVRDSSRFCAWQMKPSFVLSGGCFGLAILQIMAR